MVSDEFNSEALSKQLRCYIIKITESHSKKNGQNKGFEGGKHKLFWTRKQLSCNTFKPKVLVSLKQQEKQQIAGLLKANIMKSLQMKYIGKLHHCMHITYPFHPEI